MLSSNTNKLTWTGMTVGVIASLGIVVMTLFPSVATGFKTSILGVVYPMTNQTKNTFSGFKSSDFWGNIHVGENVTHLSDVPNVDIPTIQMTLQPISNYAQGMFLGNGMYDSYNNNQFATYVGPGDTYILSVETKSDGPGVSFFQNWGGSGLVLENSKVLSVTDAKVDMGWKKYTVKAVRTKARGTLTVYLTNNSDSVRNVQVRNLNVYVLK